MPTKTKAVTCGAPLPAGATCTKTTTHPSGRCHLHRNLTTAPSTTVGQQPQTTTVAASPAFVDGDPPVAWLPDELETGRALGHPVLVADGDITDSTVVAMRYADPTTGAPSADVLHLSLTPEGEQRMLAALGLDGTHMETVVTDVTKHGVHPLDTQHGLGDKVGQIARSYNSRVKKGEPLAEIRSVNDPRLEALQQAFTDASAKAGDDPAAQAMLAHYQAHIETLGARLSATSEPPPYLEGGKIDPPLDNWEGEYIEQVSEQVTVPNGDLAGAALPTVEVQGQRIKASLDMDTGKASWKRGSYTKKECPKKMWKVDLGDGYQALYYPEEHTSGTQGFAFRRRMTVIAPKNGDAAGAMERLDRLHLSGTPMRAAQAEYTYLENNLSALGLLDHPTVQQARVQAAEFSQAIAQTRIKDRFDELATLPAEQRPEWIRRQRIAAEAQALPHRARRLRDAAAEVCGYPSGAALAADPSYQPTPTVGTTGATYQRFRPSPTAADPAKLSLTHNVTGGMQTLISMARTGGLACTVKRRTMGIEQNMGMSESSDISSGGGSAVFTHLTSGTKKKPSHSKPQLIWTGKQAEAALGRCDWYATPGDNFGATNPEDYHYTTKVTSQRDKVDSWGHGQLMFKNGVSFTTHPPTWIVAGSSRPKVIAAFHESGVTHFADGRKVEDVVI